MYTVLHPNTIVNHQDQMFCHQEFETHEELGITSVSVLSLECFDDSRPT